MSLWHCPTHGLGHPMGFCGCVTSRVSHIGPEVPIVTSRLTVTGTRTESADGEWITVTRREYEALCHRAGASEVL